MMINGSLIKTSKSNFITRPRRSLYVEKMQNARSLLSMTISQAFLVSRSPSCRSVRPANLQESLYSGLKGPMG